MPPNEAAKTVIAEDVEIVGSIKCESNIQVDGKLNGDLSCSGNALIGASANVKGNISSDSTTVLGQISGNITAKDRIELKSTARVNGDIRSKRLTVEDGVTFVGKSEVNPAGSASGRSSSQSEAKPAGKDPEQTDAQEADQGDEKGKSGGFFGKK